MNLESGGRVETGQNTPYCRDHVADRFISNLEAITVSAAVSPPVGIHRKKVRYATGFGRLDAPLLEHDKVLSGGNRSERYLQLTCQAATKGSVSLVEIEFKMKRVVVA